MLALLTGPDAVTGAGVADGDVPPVASEEDDDAGGRLMDIPPEEEDVEFDVAAGVDEVEPWAAIRALRAAPIRLLWNMFE